MVESRADTDVRDVIAEAIHKSHLHNDPPVWSKNGWNVRDATAVLAALAEAGLVVVPAEDVAELREERDAARLLAGVRGDRLHETEQKLKAAQRAGNELWDQLNAALSATEEEKRDA